jgi:hypothetical protein
MLRVVRDDIRRRLFVTEEGEISFAQIATFLDTQLEQGTWSYSVLHDARAATTDLRPEDSRLLLTRIQRGADSRRRGPVAVVTGDERTRAVVTAHAAMAHEIGLRIAVFGDLESAELWLDREAV